MPGLAEIYRTVRREAEGSATAIERADGATRKLIGAARELVSLRAANRFDGAPGGGVGGAIAPAPARIGSGASRTTSGGGGGGGVGGGLVAIGAGPSNDPFLRSTDGRSIRPLSWIEANCRLVDQPIYNSLGAPSGRTRRVWNCGDHGIFLPVAVDALGNRVSATSSGGVTSTGTPGGRFGERRLYGRGISGNTTAEGRTREARKTPHGPDLLSDSQGSSSGPTSITGDVRAPELQQEVRETNRLLRRAITGDGGAGFRAEGGLG